MDSEDDSPTGALPLVDSRQLRLYYHTARNMHARQLAGVLERKAKQFAVSRVPLDFDARYERAVPDGVRSNVEPVARNLTRLRGALSTGTRDRLRTEGDRAVRGVLTQMNAPLDIGHDTGVDWEDERLEECPLFWRLKLQGFDFLRPAYLGYDSPSACPTELTDRLNAWLRDWAEETKVGEPGYLRRNWIPHSVALRLVNLTRYLAWYGDVLDADDRALFDRLVYKNARFLSNHVEHDVGGNHLVENAAGLLLAGAAFRHRDVDWFAEGRSILEATTDQFLADGGHFERSPMYHVLCLTRYATACDLAAALGLDQSAPVVATTRSATNHLRRLEPPDHRIPLFNDAVFGEALSLRECLSYVAATDVDTAGADGEHEREPASGTLDASGYYWLGTDPDAMLLDGGAVGPPHLPAHSHNDLLSYVFWADGERLVTDTGTYEYAPTPRRQHARSVRAHNTVQVADEEPIDIGGQYLMGRRCDPTTRVYATDDVDVFEGRYRKSRPLADGYTCRRRVFHRDTWWLVRDRVRLPSAGDVSDRVHFHPAVELTDRTGVVVAEKRDTAAAAWVYPLEVTKTDQVDSPYYPRFGERRERPALEFGASGTDVTLSYLVSTRALSTVELAERGTALRVDGVETPLPNPRLRVDGERQS